MGREGRGGHQSCREEGKSKPMTGRNGKELMVAVNVDVLHSYLHFAGSLHCRFHS